MDNKTRVFMLAFRRFLIQLLGALEDYLDIPDCASALTKREKRGLRGLDTKIT